MMFDFKRKLRNLIKAAVQSEERFFRQYVGDDTILIGGPGELFLYLDGLDASLTPCLLRYRTWEPAIGQWMQRNLRSGGCFVDIGGNIGFHSLQAARLMGSEGLVVTFEPQERMLRLFERSVSANALLYQIYPRRVAIGAVEGHVHLGKFAHLSGSATLTANELIVEHEDVPMAPLPLALEQVAVEIRKSCQPDVIKIDVEGYEIEVWEGMKAWTRGLPHLSIILEYSPVSYRDCGHDPLVLLEDFIAYGFALSALKPDGHTRPLNNEQMVEMAESRLQYDLVLTK